MGTRDANAFRSHAQKYFIKLYREGRPLPKKVLESGSGYTLSGKPLDPTSASARNYLKVWPGWSTYLRGCDTVVSCLSLRARA